MYLFFVLLISLIFPQFENKAQLIELDLGSNYPTGLYDKYADSGISLRFAYSKSFRNNGLFKWQAGVQYINFRSDYWTDEFQLENTPNGPDVSINNYEQGFVFNGGFRFTATNGLSKNGNFRPYVGGLIGLAFFSERTSYNWGDECSLWGSIWDVAFDTDFCDGNYTTDVEDRTTSPVFTLDIGTNVFFNENHKYGIDLGIRYNMLTRLKRPDTNLLYDQTENVIDQISRYIEADYYTYYLGISIKLDPIKSQQRKERRGRGKGKLI